MKKNRLTLNSEVSGNQLPEMLPFSIPAGVVFIVLKAGRFLNKTWCTFSYTEELIPKPELFRYNTIHSYFLRR